MKLQLFTKERDFVRGFIRTLLLIVGLLFLVFYQATYEAGWMYAGAFLLVVFWVMRFRKPAVTPVEETPE